MEYYGLTAFHRPLICIFVSNLDFFFNKNPFINIICFVYCEEKKCIFCNKGTTNVLVGEGVGVS